MTPNDQAQSALPAQTSTGHVLSGATWLDLHVAACHPEYEAMVGSVGIQPGWSVLDAGCGSGALIPMLADLVGPTGRIAALDLAAENIAEVHARLARWAVPCRVEPRVGSLTALPYADGAFDAVWCANVLQYWADDELLPLLAELQRVVRPGGLLAVKDVDMQLVRLFPASSFLVSHLCEASLLGSHITAHSAGSLRGRELRRWLERAGLVQVWQRTTLIERWAPLQPAQRDLWRGWLAYLAALALERGVPDADHPLWRRLRDPAAPDHLVDHPEFYACEGQVVAVGRVAERGGQPPGTL